jgi:hypothetical protein
MIIAASLRALDGFGNSEEEEDEIKVSKDEVFAQLKCVGFPFFRFFLHFVFIDFPLFREPTRDMMEQFFPDLIPVIARDEAMSRIQADFDR